jgi:YVTN family beta-propeller protein
LLFITRSVQRDWVDVLLCARPRPPSQEVSRSLGPSPATPFWIAVKAGTSGLPDKVFVSSQRDGQVVVFDQPPAFRTIKVGREPNKMVLSQDGSRLYVANGDSDSVTVIDTRREAVVTTISLPRPGYVYDGANPNSLALSP